MVWLTQAQDPTRSTRGIGLLAATYQCVSRFGLAKTTIRKDVAKESGAVASDDLSPFPGGRDELLLETVGWELGN